LFLGYLILVFLLECVVYSCYIVKWLMHFFRYVVAQCKKLDKKMLLLLTRQVLETVAQKLEGKEHIVLVTVWEL
jgi:hypothetical protein